MSNIIDDNIKKINTTYLSKKINETINRIKNKAKEVSERGKIKIEIEKCKLELRRKYRELGEFINKSYLEEKVKDFSYKEKYFELNREIQRLKKYLNILKKNINSNK